MERKDFFRRKRLLINKRLQFQYIGIVVVSLILIVSWIGWDVYQGLKAILPKVYYLNIKQEIINVQLILVLKTIIFVFIISLLSLYFSHRIAGPLYRLERDIFRMTDEADLTHTFKLRKHDDLKELAIALNQLTMRIREQFVYEGKIRGNLQKISNEIIVLLREKNNLTAAEREKIITDLQELSRLNSSSTSFKV
ncbi:MAG: hypothetical protein ABII74_06280 [Elusimicrobiota bacterium]